MNKIGSVIVLTAVFSIYPSGYAGGQEVSESRMVSEMSKRLAISPEEARHQLNSQHKAGKLRSEIEAGEPDTFAGMYIEHSPKFRVVVRFTGDARSALARKATDLPVEAQAADLSIRALRTMQNETYADLKAKNIESASQISERDGSIDFFVIDPVAAEAVRGNIRHGSKVRFKKATKLSKGEAAVEGGRPLGNAGSLSCTSELR